MSQYLSMIQKRALTITEGSLLIVPPDKLASIERNFAPSARFAMKALFDRQAGRHNLERARSLLRTERPVAVVPVFSQWQRFNARMPSRGAGDFRRLCNL